MEKINTDYKKNADNRADIESNTFEKPSSVKSAKICNKCWRPFLLTPEHERCNTFCGYSLAWNHYLSECVNCKIRYHTPKYTLKKTCVDEIPFI